MAGKGKHATHCSKCGKKFEPGERRYSKYAMHYDCGKEINRLASERYRKKNSPLQPYVNTCDAGIEKANDPMWLFMRETRTKNMQRIVELGLPL